MDYQYILVGFIVAFSALVMLRNLYRFFVNPLDHCQGCNQSGGACALSDLKKEMKGNKIKNQKSIHKNHS